MRSRCSRPLQSSKRWLSVETIFCNIGHLDSTLRTAGAKYSGYIKNAFKYELLQVNRSSCHVLKVLWYSPATKTQGGLWPGSKKIANSFANFSSSYSICSTSVRAAVPWCLSVIARPQILVSQRFKFGAIPLESEGIHNLKKIQRNSGNKFLASFKELRRWGSW